MRSLGAALVVILGGSVLVAAETPPSVSLAWRRVAPVPPDVVAGAEQEVAAVFRRAGVEISWTAAEEALPAGAIPVVVLESGRSSTLPRRLLGASSPDRAAGVWIFYPAIEAHARVRGDRRLLGRALGRVVAHEVVHAYQAVHEHAPEGLMRPQLDARLLTDEALEWDLATQSAFVRGFREGRQGTPRQAER
jgi:hypothetical protein